MTTDLAVALLLSVVAALGPFRGVTCAPAQIEQMKAQVKAHPERPTMGVVALVKRTCM